MVPDRRLASTSMVSKRKSCDKTLGIVPERELLANDKCTKFGRRKVCTGIVPYSPLFERLNEVVDEQYSREHWYSGFELHVLYPHDASTLPTMH